MTVGVTSVARSSVAGCDPLIVGLTPDFTADLPDPAKSANSSCVIEYLVQDNGDASWDESDGAWYKLTAINCHAGATAPSEGIQQDNELARCPSTCTPPIIPCIPANSDFYSSYAVYSNGGECE
jgi:hypothetical protein